MSVSPVAHKVIGVAAIWNERQQILIDKRRQHGLHGGLWEFPGGKIEPGRNDRSLHRTGNYGGVGDCRRSWRSPDYN
jgi:adenine-specific DNA glycosylase